MTAGVCPTCGVWQACKLSHYRSVHQKFTRVHFGWDGHEMTVERDNKTSRFDCPRCEKSYPEPSGLRKHARSRQFDCSIGPQRGINLPGRAEKSNASDADHVPINMPPRDVPKSSSPATSRRLSQRRGPQTTRTQRALVRGYWKDEYTVHQIGQYMNLNPRNIWDAINNESNDDLDEDEDYRDGIIGDVINVENMLLDIEPGAEIVAKAEELQMDEVDEKIKVEVQSTNDGQNAPESEIEVIETPPMLNLVALRRPNRNKGPNLQRSVRPADIVSVSTTTILYNEENGQSSNSTSAGPSTRGDSMKKQNDVSKSGPLRAGEIVPGTSRFSPVRAFLEQLKRPLGRLETAFSDFGIRTGQDLDVLCELQDQWELLQSFLGERQGVTQLQWMIIRAGLEAHASQLRQ